jgi:hypothetical protein
MQPTSISVDKDPPLDQDLLHKDHIEKIKCTNCSELKTAVTMPQDSILSLSKVSKKSYFNKTKRAKSDLMVSSPTISYKSTISASSKTSSVRLVSQAN